MAADSGFLRLVFLPCFLIWDPASGPFSGSARKFPAEFLKGFIQVRNRNVQFLNGFLEFLDLCVLFLNCFIQEFDQIVFIFRHSLFRLSVLVPFIIMENMAVRKQARIRLSAF